ncbi:MAG TPA: GntP family permease [Opitutaceae bacterium]|nr:GntP family permease [Opitutaceae bacterium]
MTLLRLGLVLNPLLIVGLSVVCIVVSIAVFRLHAFFSLLFAATLVALLTVADQPGEQRFSKAVDAVMTSFGTTAGNLGGAIALAAVIGVALMESGAADKIVRRLIAVLGESRAALALCACSFLLSGPVFVDTVFMLMLPLARALALRTGRDYVLYVMAIGAGGVVANGVIPPAPGPLYVADALKLPIGHAIPAGVLFGVVPALGGLAIARWFNARNPIPPRPLAGDRTGATTTAPRDESELPGFAISIAPVLLPFALIAADATAGLFAKNIPAALATVLHFLGNKNVALLFGAALAVALQARRKNVSLRKIGALFGAPLETGAIIILIVSAGGAYGAMIKNAGVGDSIKAMFGAENLNPVLLAWTITALIRGAQGSATVATIAGASIMTSLAAHGGFGVHPLYIFLAIGFGSKCLPWMNDAGFWVVSRISGLTQGEMLRTWSPVLTLISLLGLAEVWMASAIWPQLPF